MPHLLLGARGGMGSGHKGALDHMFTDGLEDAYTGRAMGSFARRPSMPAARPASKWMRLPSNP